MDIYIYIERERERERESIYSAIKGLSHKKQLNLVLQFHLKFSFQQ